MNLYTIDEEIMSCVDMDTGEIIDAEKLNALEMERDAKIENIALWIKNLNADVEALKAEKMAFDARKNAAENKVKSLKKYLSDYLAGTTYKSPKVAISFRRSEAVDISDMTKIPQEYLTYTEPTADKTAIKKAIKGGATIAGAALVENYNIQIK